MTCEQFISHVEGTQKAFRRFLVALCCGDTALADDIAQESYIKAYLSCEGFRDPEKFNAWIYRIGYHTFIDHKRSARVFSDYGEATEKADATHADEQFRYQSLYIALDNLSGKERTSVILHYLEGYAIKEIAEILVTTPDAVKQHLARGRNHLRALLSNS